MKNSAELANNSATVLSIIPTILGSFASTLIAGPATLIGPVLLGTLYYLTRNSLGPSMMGLNSLQQLEPNQDIKEISETLGLPKPAQMFLAKGRHKFCAKTAFNNVIMAENFIGCFDEEEKNFIWAHELAHVKRGDNNVSSAAYSNVSINGLSFAGLLTVALTQGGHIQNDFLMASAQFAMAATASATPLFLRNSKSSNHKAEFDCDKRAVLATGNIDAGIRALNKMNIGKNRNYATSTHPAMSIRIRALEALKIGEEAHQNVIKVAMKNKGNSYPATQPSCA